MTQIGVRSTHLFDIQDLSIEAVELLLQRACYWEFSQEEKMTSYSNQFVVNLFFEPSTRTRFSFELAQKRLGMQVIDFDIRSSSLSKGESLYDTLKTLSTMGVRVAVIRHPHENILLELVKQDVGCAILNAGAGMMAHPTQSLLDLYTIQKHFGRLEGIKVAMVGDIAHSRVVRSNLALFKRFGLEVTLSGVGFTEDEILERDVPYGPLDEILSTVDVVMILRVQAERHGDGVSFDPNTYLNQYGLTIERFNRMKPDTIVMHPGPVNRGIEIVSELVEHPRSKIFEQMGNGVYIRMATLEYALGVL